MSTEERTDLADDLAEVYDKLSEEVEEVAADDVVEDAAEEDEVDETEDSEELTEDEEIEEEEDGEEESSEDDEEEIEEEAEEEKEEESIEPLAHWKMDDKEYFKTLPSRAKEFLVARDREFQSQKDTEVMHIKQALEPIREEMQQFGVSEDQAVRTLVGAHKMLKDDPKRGIKHLMSQYQLTPEELFSQDDTQDAADPRIVNLENKAAQFEQDAIAREQAMLAGRIDEFRKNAEFFDEVTGEMTQLAAIERARNPGVTPDIEALYKKACRLNEGVWEKLQAKERKARGKAKSNRRSENAAGAKVKGTASSKKAKTKAGSASMRDDLLASWDEVSEREQGTAL